jgi:MFS family permease
MAASHPNINLDRGKVFCLAACQALSMTGITVLFTVAALIGQALATDKTLSTLPLAGFQIATMLTTIPASLLMQRWGRRQGFMLGIGITAAGALLGMQAIFSSSFVTFCAATVLIGSGNGFAGFYRFAAAEVAAEQFRAQAIALVISGGVVAALLGPQLATWSKEALSVTFAGSLGTIAILQLLVLGCLLPIQFPQLQLAEYQTQGRSLSAIVQQPVFLVAVLGSMVGYGVMVLVMIATPLAITAEGHAFHVAATVIQWHVLGMFAPSFVTGSLIARYGILTVMSWGVGLNVICIAISLLGSGILSYSFALLLLGIGWNFLFIGSTTLLTKAYTPAEKGKTQAIHDFLMFGFVALSTVLSGGLFHMAGWRAVNWAGLPLLLILLIAMKWLNHQRDRSAHCV